MLKITLSNSLLLAVSVFAVIFTAQGQVPLWLGKMEQVRLFEHKRTELIRILGEPEEDGNAGGDAAYYFDWGHLFVLSVDEVCTQQNRDYPGDVAKNKERIGELRLVIDADQKITLADLGLDVAGFQFSELKNQAAGATSKAYVNHNAGRYYEIRSNGTVDMIAYIAGRDEIIQTCK